MAADSIRISTDPMEMDVPLIHWFLSEHSKWARGISLELVKKSIGNSLCFGGFLGAQQVAFARVITDRATFAYLGDVFVLPEYRSRGYSKVLMAAVMAHPELQGLRRFTLVTLDAHGLYAQFGFAAPSRPERMMERYVPDIYAKSE